MRFACKWNKYIKTKTVQQEKKCSFKLCKLNIDQLKANTMWECAQGEAKSGCMCKNMIYLGYHSLQHPAETFTAHVWDCL